MNRGRMLAIGAITITSILWGTTGTAATFAPDAGPLAIGAAALGIGGILQALIAIPALRAQRGRLRANLPLVAVGAVAVAIYPLAFYSSMHLAGVALGTVVSLASAPLASGVLEWFVQRTPLGRWWMVAAGLGIIGSLLLCLSKMADGPGGAGNTLAGMALGLVAGATYACYSWCARRLMDRGVGRSASMGAVFGVGGILLLPVLVLTGAPLLASTQAFAVAAYMALVPMFLGYVLFGYGLARLGASTATTITLSEPAVAAILAVAIVGETLSPAGWSGLAIIGAALVILALAPANAAASTDDTAPTSPTPARDLQPTPGAKP
ncbi:DMT family transporter [Paeniglutamicibacter kerguelensis]|uniref:DME family drug/metabolite transporter n=1 Tax=Paeniglutamicibacter kerguelensis TaxID=254788 RepID=A0ABS4XJH1_9MICC|nr:EamA family transporter [Paeniglutamicibacter kerguelensis]MBP2387819.1 DME family drug/metabolite transporter [Paeniglutamicibacter kerguelensis]